MTFLRGRDEAAAAFRKLYSFQAAISESEKLFWIDYSGICTVFENHRKVSFNIASEASYIYILSRQKFIKKAKSGPFWRVFLKYEACGQTVLPDRSVLIGQKLLENAKIKKL